LHADGTARFPYNEFDDEVSAGAGSFNVRQYFDYGLPNQRLYGVKQIYRTLADGSLQAKQPNFTWNQLQGNSGADPLIDGNLDPWLAPWDGTPNSCNSANSKFFQN
jgi:hypothetical protein